MSAGGTARPAGREAGEAVAARGDEALATTRRQGQDATATRVLGSRFLQPWNGLPRTALVGAAAWITLLTSGALGLWHPTWIEALLALGARVVMPIILALRARVADDLAGMDETPGPSSASQGFAGRAAPKAARLTAACDTAVGVLLLPVALVTAASFVVPPGVFAACAAAPWVVVCSLIALGDLARAAAPLLGRRRGVAVWSLLAASALYLPVGGFWLAASRLGVPIAGFLLPIPALTAVHFHYTMFALPTIAAATGMALEGSERAGRAGGSAMGVLFTALAAALVFAPAMLLTGWVLRYVPFKLGATALLAAAAWSLAGIVFSLSGRVTPPTARRLLRVGCAAVVAGMSLAVLYGAQEYWERDWISIPRMAQVHGALNGVGFTLSAAVGWLLADRRAPRL